MARYRTEVRFARHPAFTVTLANPSTSTTRRSDASLVLMSHRVENLLDQAMDLDLEERAELAGRLLHTLEPADPDVEESWRREIRKRIDELDSGAVTPVSAEEANQRIFRLPDARSV